MIRATIHVPDDTEVTLPFGVVARALRKARTEYVRSCKEHGQDPGSPSECWTEFELLAEALDDVVWTTP